MSHDEQTPGERMDRREQHVLLVLIQDPFPWTVAELALDMGKEGRWTEDAVAALDAAGLVHRFVVLRPAKEDQPEERAEVVIPTRAARRLDECREGRCDAAAHRRPYDAHESRSWRRYTSPAAR